MWDCIHLQYFSYLILYVLRLAVLYTICFWLFLMPLSSPAATSTSFSHFSFRKPPLNNSAWDGLELTPLTFHHFSVFPKLQGTNIPSPKCGRRHKSSSWPLRYGKTLAELRQPWIANNGDWFGWKLMGDSESTYPKNDWTSNGEFEPEWKGSRSSKYSLLRVKILSAMN